MDPKLQEALNKIKELQGKVTRLEEKLSTKSSLSLGQDAAGIIDVSVALNDRAKVLEKSIESLSQAGATFARGGTLGQALTDTVTSLDQLIASGGSGKEAITALTKSFEQFEKLSQQAGKVSKNLAGDLATQAGLLDRLGISYGDFSKNIDLAIFSFSQTSAGVRDINLQIKNLSDEMGMLPSVVSRNFQSVAKNLAYNFDQIKTQFVGLQQMANKTGVSIDTLMGKFGRPMDTISGASDMAAKINSLLGRNAFSATELLMMDEKTRAESIRDALQRSGAADTALQGGVRGKFALQSIQEVLGMDLDQTRRFIQGGAPESVKAQMAASAGSGENMAQNFKEPAGRLEDALEKLRTTILQQQADPFSRIAIRARERFITPGKMSQADIELGATGLLTRIGTAGESTDYIQRFKAFEKKPLLVQELTRYAQLGILEPKKYDELIGQIITDNVVDEKTILDQIKMNLTDVNRAKLAVAEKLPSVVKFDFLRSAKPTAEAEAAYNEMLRPMGPNETEDQYKNRIENAGKKYEEALKQKNKKSTTVPSVIPQEIKERGESLEKIQAIQVTSNIVMDSKVVAQVVSQHFVPGSYIG